jgi:hypothetical protein
MTDEINKIDVTEYGDDGVITMLDGVGAVGSGGYLTTHDVALNAAVEVGIDAQARIAELEAALATARSDAFQEAANACCHPTNVHDGGESAICRGRVLAALGDGA